MDVAGFIKNKIRAYRPVRRTDDAPGLVLYRQLRRAENELVEARECLNRKIAAQQDMLPSDIDRLRRDVAQLEEEYQSAQMNVRAYFYQEICPVSRPHGELTAGHPAQ